MPVLDAPPQGLQVESPARLVRVPDRQRRHQQLFEGLRDGGEGSRDVAASRNRPCPLRPERPGRLLYCLTLMVNASYVARSWLAET